jgi:hypothetical protein
MLSEKWPGGQAVHCVLPSASAYVPAGHGVQAASVSLRNWPLGLHGVWLNGGVRVCVCVQILIKERIWLKHCFVDEIFHFLPVHNTTYK